ncbi:MAG: outer membrane lipoprotein carrier protein LolA [Desulfotignum sp.]|jgi:outer membrane lipoprotein carrier protein|nr:outer membrane lipoprotein carrier protein LolA [Desulfotignum sp.]
MKFMKPFLIIALVSCWAVPGNASDISALAQTILDGIEERYAGKSFSADFFQTSTLAALDIEETASGKALFSHPGKMKWQYLSPERHDIITNGTDLWIYRPEENQVMQGDAVRFFQSGAGGAFLSDISLIRKNYTVSVKEATDDWVELLLEDQADNPDIQRIIIRVSRSRFLISSVTTENAFGDTTHFAFTDIRFQSIPDERFDFTIPSGVNILDME